MAWLCSYIHLKPWFCRSEDSANATDNAAAALGRVLEYQASTINTAPLVSTWLNSLPLRHDIAEAQVTHAQLVRFLEKSDERQVPAASSLPHLLNSTHSMSVQLDVITTSEMWFCASLEAFGYKDGHQRQSTQQLCCADSCCWFMPSRCCAQCIIPSSVSSCC